MSKKKTKVGASTWLVIALIVASIVFEFVDIFTRGSVFMWLGAGCLIAALVVIAVTVKSRPQR
ncbi:MAG: hypothetical protein Q4P06_06265 [Actinomycetaceae bacterium]|nr:hypothetical protein [Actinomycetaceae bacterium]